MVATTSCFTLTTFSTSSMCRSPSAGKSTWCSASPWWARRTSSRWLTVSWAASPTPRRLRRCSISCRDTPHWCTTSRRTKKSGRFCFTLKRRQSLATSGLAQTCFGTCTTRTLCATTSWASRKRLPRPWRRHPGSAAPVSRTRRRPRTTLVPRKPGERKKAARMSVLPAEQAREERLASSHLRAASNWSQKLPSRYLPCLLWRHIYLVALAEAAERCRPRQPANTRGGKLVQERARRHRRLPLHHHLHPCFRAPPERIYGAAMAMAAVAHLPLQTPTVTAISSSYNPRHDALARDCMPLQRRLGQNKDKMQRVHLPGHTPHHRLLPSFHRFLRPLCIVAFLGKLDQVLRRFHPVSPARLLHPPAPVVTLRHTHLHHLHFSPPRAQQ
jgi:hypothetical protein